MRIKLINMKKILLALLILTVIGCDDDNTKVEYNTKDSVVVDSSKGDSVKTIEIDSTYIDKK